MARNKTSLFRVTQFSLSYSFIYAKLLRIYPVLSQGRLVHVSVTVIVAHSAFQENASYPKFPENCTSAVYTNIDEVTTDGATIHIGSTVSYVFITSLVICF